MPLSRRLNTSSCCWNLPALAAAMLKLPVVLGGPVRLGGLLEGGGGGGGQVGGGGALHLLHAVVTTVIVVHHVNLHGRNSACPNLYIMRYESEWNLVLPSSLVKKMKQ